jgi:hypothetical protein
MYIHDAKRPFPRYGVCAFSQFVNLDFSVARLVDAATLSLKFNGLGIVLLIF